MKNINDNRRRLLKYMGITTAVAASYPNLLLAGKAQKYSQPSANFHPDVEIVLTQNVANVPILNGTKTRVWKINGELLKGTKGAVENHNGTYLAPTIRLQKGQKVRIYLRNNLPAESILHWHGLHVPAEMDGNPMYAIGSNERFVYEFEVLNRAGTYWYHAHTHSVTAKQVYSGLAGLFIVHDTEERKLGLPSGEFDVPLVIQDRSFDANNQLSYSNHMMQRMQGFLGNQILVNGQPDFILPVTSRAYRLRILNGSNSRIYKLAWDDGTAMTLLGVDGGLLDRPQKMPYIMLAPAQRREIWVDFSGQRKGSELILRSVAFASSSMHGMMGGGMGGGMMGRMGRHNGGMMKRHAIPQGDDYPVLKIRVVKQAVVRESLPKRLTTSKSLRLKDAENAQNPRKISLSMRRMSALLNGRSYKMNDVRPDEKFAVNTLQVLQFDNSFLSGMHGMMNMPHPMHLHGEQFQILKREVNSRFKNNYLSVAKGLVDQGWQDTVLVMPGERVTILKPFNDFKGIFMYHCHNLEHEDMGMMRDLLIT